MCECASTSAGMTVLPVRSTRAAPGGANLAASAHASEPAVLDEERGVLDRRVAVADDEARPLVEGDARSGCLLGACLTEPDDGEQAGDGNCRIAHPCERLPLLRRYVPFDDGHDEAGA